MWWSVCVFLFVALLPPGAQADSLVALPTRPNVIQKFLLIMPEKTEAAVILFPGGAGVIGLEQGGAGPVIRKDGNFLVRSRDEFARHGFMVAVMDAPSDHDGGNGMIGGFRAGEEHALDIAAVVTYLKQQAAVPVWLVGTSRGTESAANAAIRLKQDIQGVVLTSSVTRRNKKGVDVLSMELEAVAVPVMVVAHEADDCKVTPASDAERIAKRLKRAPRKEVKLMTGGLPPKSAACEAFSAHGFLGIEKETVDAIAQFIKSN